MYPKIREINDLLRLHSSVMLYRANWQKYEAAESGFESLVNMGVFKQHDRESLSNFEKRLAESDGPNYSEAVISILDYYMLQSEVSRSFGDLASFELWQMFQKDSDYYRTDYNTFLNEARRKSSIFGHVGILVDMPTIKTDSQRESIERKVYPYLCLYSPLDILDWVIKKDDLGRPELVALKLKEGDGTYKIWEKDVWRSYAIQDGKVLSVDEGDNLLGEIPFVWLFNRKKSRYIGSSDLRNIAGLDISIYKNLMQIEEIIDLAAFPMMRKPMQREGEIGDEERTGTSAIQEFDPSLGEAGKPDWMRTEVSEPIGAILDTITWKKQQIYGNATLSESQTERSTPESGYALSIRRDLLNAALVSKAKYLAEAEENILRFWCKWVQKDDWAKEIRISRPKRFSVEQLKLDIENAIMGSSIVHSEKFTKELEKKLAREMLGTTVEDEFYKKIDDQIDAHVSLNVPEVE